MTRLYIIRHGEVESGGLYYGHRDVPLSERGRRQLERVAAALAELELAAVYSSDLARAVDSARPIAASHGLEPGLDPAFREMHLGVLEGLAHAEVGRRHPELAGKRYEDMWDYAFPGGGESMLDIAARAGPALERLLSRHADQSVALVAHNSVNRVLLGRALGLHPRQVFGFSQDFGCVNRVRYREAGPRVELLNWTPRAPDPGP